MQLSRTWTATAPLLLVFGLLASGRTAARRICRLCDVDGYGHHEGRCPVSIAADRAEGGRCR